MKERIAFLDIIIKSWYDFHDLDLETDQEDKKNSLLTGCPGRELL